ncbi:hypothetical protein OSB04_027982 [Centaurea solstitialis]|uniref:Integrase catalytic domain-containing protein n=1 Tax=Centaurea solstitialis TaxID=347529 RepID=A0AA38WAQ6_9ASTR|nr:hypothetical protein OSB04_027982 [Centaurea solstitialis]
MVWDWILDWESGFIPLCMFLYPSIPNRNEKESSCAISSIDDFGDEILIPIPSSKANQTWESLGIGFQFPQIPKDSSEPNAPLGFGDSGPNWEKLDGEVGTLVFGSIENIKDEALSMLKTYKAEVENQLDKKIKILRPDRGGEYEFKDFVEFCLNHDIVHQTMAPYTPQQNGVADSEMLSMPLCGHNVTTMRMQVYTDTGIATRKLPSYKRMKVWGCLVKVQVPLPKRTKLGPKTIGCVYLGPIRNNVAYRFLVYKSNVEDIHNNTILESIEAEFFEYIFPYKDKKKPLILGKGDAMDSSEAPYWKETIQSEIDSIVQNNTWKLVDRPSDVILSKEISRDPNGYTLTQSHYVEKVLRKFGHYDDRPAVTPFDPSSQLKINQGDSASQLEYTQHLPVLEGYCDANWISNHSESKSTSVYVFTLRGAAVSWKSSKQTMNTRSTMEDEFVSLDKATEEAEWLKSFLEGISLWPKPVTAISIHCDSMVTLKEQKIKFTTTNRETSDVATKP